MASNQPLIPTTTTKKQLSTASQAPTTNLHSMQFPVIHNQSPQTRPPLQYSPQPEQEKRRQKSSSPHSQRRKSEINRNKSEVQREKENLEDLMRKFGSQARTLDEMDNESDKIKRSIEILASQMKAKQMHHLSPSRPQQLQQTLTTTNPLTSPQSQTQTIQKEVGKLHNEISLLKSILTLLLLPFQLVLQLLKVIYQSLNWNFILLLVLGFELSIIVLIWGLRKSYYNSAYGDPYEAVIHGTFGAEPSSTWSTVFSGAVTIIQDFFGEVMNGGRGFGSHSYSGHVPI